MRWVGWGGEKMCVCCTYSVQVGREGGGEGDGGEAGVGVEGEVVNHRQVNFFTAPPTTLPSQEEVERTLNPPTNKVEKLRTAFREVKKKKVAVSSKVFLLGVGCKCEERSSFVLRREGGCVCVCGWVGAKENGECCVWFKKRRKTIIEPPSRWGRWCIGGSLQPCFERLRKRG